MRAVDFTRRLVELTKEGRLADARGLAREHGFDCMLVRGSEDRLELRLFQNIGGVDKPGVRLMVQEIKGEEKTND
jgi:hypothetical protein